MGTGRWEAMENFVDPTLEAIENYLLKVVTKAGSQR
jgi:hypothetical protein